MKYINELEIAQTCRSKTEILKELKGEDFGYVLDAKN